MRTARAAVLTAAALVSMSACGGGAATGQGTTAAPEPEPATETPEATTEPEGETTEAAGSECDPAPDELLTRIESGALDGTGMDALEGAVYRSPDYQEAYFVAVEFAATGIDNQVGVWVTNGLEPGTGITMSVDGMAKEFTDWPDAETTDAAISPADPAVAVVRGCLE